MRIRLPWLILFVIMRVALVSEPMSSRMGAERAVSGLAKYLRRLGVELTPIDPRNWQGKLNFDVLHWFGTGSRLTDSIKLVREATRASIPIVASSTLWPIGPKDLALAFAPFLEFSHEGLTLISIAKLLDTIRIQQVNQKEILKMATVICFTSEGHAERANEVLASFGEHEIADFEIVPNAIDHEEILGIPTLPWEERFPHVVSLGRTELWKNRVRLREAVKALRSRREFANLELTCIGKRLMELEAAPWLNVIDEVSPSLALSILAMNRVHALPSLGDFPGLVNLEAAALGCQVVGSKPPYSTLDEYLPEAILVDPTNVGEIVLGLQVALTTKPEPVLKERVLTYFTYETTAKRVFEIYQGLIS